MNPTSAKEHLVPKLAPLVEQVLVLLSTIVAVNRGWIGRDTALKRLVKIVDFLIKADCYHGIYPHFMNGTTGKTIPLEDWMMALILWRPHIYSWACYVPKNILMETHLLKNILETAYKQMWNVADWNWHSQW